MKTSILLQFRNKNIKFWHKVWKLHNYFHSIIYVEIKSSFPGLFQNKTSIDQRSKNEREVECTVMHLSIFRPVFSFFSTDLMIVQTKIQKNTPIDWSDKMKRSGCIKRKFSPNQLKYFSKFCSSRSGWIYQNISKVTLLCKTSRNKHDKVVSLFWYKTF